MTAFALAIAAAFADPNLALAAVYTGPEAGAVPVACRVILARPDRDGRLFDTGVSAAARVAELRVAEVAAVEEGGTLAVAGETFRIDRATRPDDHRLIWRLDLS